MQINGNEKFENEYFFKLASKTWDMGRWSWDVKKNLISQRLGSNKEFNGSIDEWLSILTLDFKKTVRTELESLWKSPQNETLFRCKLQNEPHRLLEIIAYIERDSDGIPLFFQGMVKPINDEGIALNQAKQELGVCRSELRSLSYTISHDLSAPLRGIEGWSLALQEDYESYLDDKGKKYLRRIRNEVQHMASLLSDLTRISHLLQKDLLIAKINLSDVVEKISSQLKENHRPRHVEMVIAPGLEAYGDGELIALAIANLLENAIKFSDQTKTTQIEFGKTAEAFFIKDNGIGFDVNTGEKIFEIFHKLHKTKDFSGNGVGLAIVKSIINLHQGKIWAESKVNNGSTFYFTVNALA